MRIKIPPMQTFQTRYSLPVTVVASFIFCFFSVRTEAAFLPEERIDQRSARLEALQLDVVVEDPANKIGLERFGENPAGLVLDEEATRVNALYEHRNESDAFALHSHQDVDWPALYAVLRTKHQALAVEGSNQINDHSEGADKQKDAGFRYSGRIGNFLGGAEANYLSEELEYTVVDYDAYLGPILRHARRGYKSNPVHYGAGLGYDAQLGGAHFIVGASTRRADEGQPNRYSSELRYSNVEGAGQAIFRTNSLEMGFVGRHHSTTSNGLDGHIDDDGSAMRLRGLARYKVLRMGWDASLGSDHYNQKISDFFVRPPGVEITDKERNVTIGVAATKTDHWLIGYERGWSRNNDDIAVSSFIGSTFFLTTTMSNPTLHGTSDTFGVEGTFDLLTIRGSYASFNQDVYDASYHPLQLTGHKWGTGASLRLMGQDTLDVSYSRLSSRFPDGSEGDKETRTMAQVNVVF